MKLVYLRLSARLEWWQTKQRSESTESQAGLVAKIDSRV